MSRVAGNPISVAKNIEVKLAGQTITVKGPRGELSHEIHPSISVQQEDNQLKVSVVAKENQVHRGGQSRQAAMALAGTTRALVNNMVVGVREGFEGKLLLVGVGYRAQLKGKVIGLTLGLSHPVNYALPEGVTAEVPVPTEIVLKSANKQLLGQVKAEIRAFRPPESYKGKGIRYADEVIVLKETKK